jgi:hypothetical protein
VFILCLNAEPARVVYKARVVAHNKVSA